MFTKKEKHFNRSHKREIRQTYEEQQVFITGSSSSGHAPGGFVSLYKHISILIFRVQTKEKTGTYGQLFEGKDDMVFVHLVSSPVEIFNFLSTVPIFIFLSDLIRRQGKEKMTWYYLKYYLV